MVKVATLLVAGLLMFTVGAGKTRQQPGTAAQGQPESSAPKEKAEDKVEKHIHLTISPVVYDSRAQGYVPKTTFKAGALVQIDLLMTNSSDQALNVFNLGTYMHNRLRLLKDGVPVRYLNDVPKKLKASEDNGDFFISTREATLEPNSANRYALLKLWEWYGPLQPGHYELTVKHRFNWRGGWIESNTVEFEVVP